MARKEDKLRPYRIDYFDINEMKDNDLALVKSVMTRAVTAEEAVSSAIDQPVFNPALVVIRAYRYYKKLGTRKKDVYKSVEELFPAAKALKVMEQVELYHANAKAPAPDHAVADPAYGVTNATFYKNNSGTQINPADSPATDSNGHQTRFSDSSLYDEVCVNCGATDTSGDLEQPCPSVPPPTSVPPTVFDKFKEILIEMMGVDESEVTPTARFVDDLGADSLDAIELVMAAEEVFDIEIQDDDAEKLLTVQDAVDYITKATAPNSGPDSPATVAVVADLNGMLSHDAHEQTMDTFVPDITPGVTTPQLQAAVGKKEPFTVHTSDGTLGVLDPTAKEAVAARFGTPKSVVYGEPCACAPASPESSDSLLYKVLLFAGILGLIIVLLCLSLHY